MATMEELYQQYLLTQPGIGVSQNRYRELMSQMRPFANPYPAGTGLLAGGTVAPVVPKVPARTNPMGTYGGGGGTGGGGMTNPAWDALTDAQRSEFYANNPAYAKATQIGQAIFPNTLLGKAQAFFDPDKVNREGLIAQGFDFNAYQKARDTFRESELKYAREQEAIEQARVAEAEAVAREVNNIQAGLDVAAEAESAARGVNNVQAGLAVAAEAEAAAVAAREADRNNWAAGIIAQVQAQQAANSAAQAAQTSYESGIGNPGESIGFTSSESGIGNPGEFSYTSYESGIGNPGESYGGGYDSGGYGTGDSSGFGGGTDSGSDGWAKGGKVTKNRLKGPDPKGPDEGYGALLGGEFVIKKSSVKKYGEGLLSMINDGKIPAKKLKSLLG